MVLDENFAHVGGKQVRVTKDGAQPLYGGIGYKEY